MKLHERFFVVETAKAELAKAVVDLEKEFELSPAEIVGLLLDKAASYNNYVLRMERHGDYGKKSDEA